MTYPHTFSAILVAGGQSTRFSPDEDKLLAPLNHKPVLAHSLAGLLSVRGLERLVLVCREWDQYRPIVEMVIGDGLAPLPPVSFAPAGETRRQSVWNGLRALPLYTRTVLIHDAARPLLSVQAVEALLSQFESPGISIGCPVTDTLKQVNADYQVKATVDRSSLWTVQTPQVFDFDMLKQAHEQIPGEAVVTDDVQLMELAGFGPITLIQGPKTNLKITSADDLALAEALLTFMRV